jgi:thymidylate synthase ThyX
MNIEDMRKLMGTNPKELTPLKTEFYEGVRGIKVKLLDKPTNPYKSMFNMGTSTWGNHIDKWDEATPEARFWVVSSVLQFKSLPLAMEAPSFTFAVEGCSRSAFDQIARARIGAVFSSMGIRDNDHSDIGFRVPQSIWNNAESLAGYMETCLKSKEEYHKLIAKGQSSWQDARALLPMSMCHNFSMSMNYMALRNFCNKRLKGCEQSDTVAAAWLIRGAVKDEFPLLGQYLRPSCDWKGICEYHQNNEMSEAFGCLFKECGRNKCNATDNYATFNYACSDINVIAKQLGIEIPSAKQDMPPKDYAEIDARDEMYFENLVV